jgi:prophage DNA circulation protein
MALGSGSDFLRPSFFPGVGLIRATGFFRGAAFRLDSYETTVGRRAVVHEYPLRNTPMGEDLGRKARNFRFTAYVFGAGWEFARDALINACEADGQGLLIHPFHGDHMVYCHNCVVSEARASGQRYASFQLEFGEAGSFDAPTYTEDPGQALLGQARDGYGVIEGSFAG